MSKLHDILLDLHERISALEGQFLSTTQGSTSSTLTHKKGSRGKLLIWGKPSEFQKIVDSNSDPKKMLSEMEYLSHGGKEGGVAALMYMAIVKGRADLIKFLFEKGNKVKGSMSKLHLSEFEFNSKEIVFQYEDANKKRVFFGRETTLKEICEEMKGSENGMQVYQLFHEAGWM